jgi:hypothetical protein
MEPTAEGQKEGKWSGEAKIGTSTQLFIISMRKKSDFMSSAFSSFTVI